MENTFENKIAILAEVWENKDEPLFEELVGWYDITFPLAWAIQHGKAIPTEPSLLFFNRAYAGLLELLGIEDNLYSEYAELLEVEE